MIKRLTVSTLQTRSRPYNFKLTSLLVVQIQNFVFIKHFKDNLNINLYFIFHQKIQRTQRVPIPFRFVKSANNSKSFTNKFSRRAPNYSYSTITDINIPTWIILSTRSSIITHRNVNFDWISTIRVQLTLQRQLPFQRL